MSHIGIFTFLLVSLSAIASTLQSPDDARLRGRPSMGPNDFIYDSKTHLLGTTAVAPSLLNMTRSEFVLLPDSSALCLDGSRYGYFICKPKDPTTHWSINIQGGGWCYNEADCLARAKTRLGSSTNWSASAPPCDMESTVIVVNMYYCDGASFSGYREAPWPVPGGGQLMFRGIRNLDATLDHLFATEGLAGATSLMLTGGSAGGLSTFLHLDHVASRVPKAKVYGVPLCGFFLDHGNDGFAPPNQTYTRSMQYVFRMQNSSGSLSRKCQDAYGADAWKCIMAPHAASFIQQQWFALQSRFDHWQLSAELFLPCMQAQPYQPPYPPSSCTPREDGAIAQYGPAFMAQFDPLRLPDSRNGGFIDACIIHGSTTSKIDGLTNWEAVNAWLSGGKQHWHVMRCNGSETAGPCDTAKVCAPYP